VQRRSFIGGLVSGLLCDPVFAADPMPAMQETPLFADRVKAAALPPAAQRIPGQPLVVRRFPGDDGPGRQGGQLDMLISSARETSLMTVYSYTRLIVYDDRFKLHPDILESYDDNGGRSFTFRLRAGHKWSDGHPFTTEDFRFFWEDIANNKELSPGGPSVELLVDEQPPKVDIVDDSTIRYSWPRPNPYFIESQARAAPLFLFRPAHYLRQFHPKYTDPAEIARRARGGQSAGNWVQIFRRADVMFANDNVDLPSLNPWIATTPSPAQRYVFVRNPFYHRIDEKGLQLPYVDRVVFTMAAATLIPAKAGLGESDLQSRYLNMRDYTFLKKSARTSGAEVRLWEVGSGSQVAIYPNLNANDAEWRRLFREVRFRRALSIAIDREELNQVAFIGMATPSNNTIMSRSVLFKPEYATRWAQYDPALANKLLDEIGLKRGPDGIRLLADGRPAIIIVESQRELTEEADVLQLITDHWRKIGIKILVKQQTLENFRLRNLSGEALMMAYAGIVTAAPTPNTSPREFAPTMRGGLQWPKWGLYVESNGRQGEKCDLESASRLLDYVGEWENAVDEAGRRRAWEKILQTNTDEVFSIGTVNGARQPVVVGPKVRNVPKEGYYAWDPGGYIGLYQPDTFWVSASS